MRGIVQAGLHAMPLVTRFTFVCQVIGFVAGVAFPSVVNAACLQPSKALMYFQLHRLLTYAVLHRNLIHFILNMVGLLVVSPRLEAAMGSVRYGHIFLVMTMVVAVVYSLGAALAYLIVGINFSFWNICTIGLTSPLLTMAVIYVYCFSVSSSVVSVYGLQLPPTVLPPLMLICTLFLPTTSFWCNFTGIVLGYMYVQGVVQQRVQLSNTSVRMVEESGLGLFVKHWPCFVSCPDLALPTTAADAADSVVATSPAAGHNSFTAPAPQAGTPSVATRTALSEIGWQQDTRQGLSIAHSSNGGGGDGDGAAHGFRPYRPPPAPSDPERSQLHPSQYPHNNDNHHYYEQRHQLPEPQLQQREQQQREQYDVGRTPLSSSSHASGALSIGGTTSMGPVLQEEEEGEEDDADEFYEPASSLNVTQ